MPTRKHYWWGYFCNFRYLDIYECKFKYIVKRCMYSYCSVIGIYNTQVSCTLSSKLKKILVKILSNISDIIWSLFIKKHRGIFKHFKFFSKLGFFKYTSSKKIQLKYISVVFWSPLMCSTTVTMHDNKVVVNSPIVFRVLYVVTLTYDWPLVALPLIQYITGLSNGNRKFQHCFLWMAISWMLLFMSLPMKNFGKKSDEDVPNLQSLWDQFQSTKVSFYLTPGD